MKWLLFPVLLIVSLAISLMIFSAGYGSSAVLAVNCTVGIVLGWLSARMGIYF